MSPSPTNGDEAARPVDEARTQRPVAGDEPQDPSGSRHRLDPFRQAVVEELQRSAIERARGDRGRAVAHAGRVYELVLDSAAPADARELAWVNVGTWELEAFDRDGSVNHLLVAHELFHRVSASELTMLRTKYKHGLLQANVDVDRPTRFNIIFVDDHPPGTLIRLDGEDTCHEPCLVAVPIDAKNHLLRFVGVGGTAELTWSPSSPDELGPIIPSLRGE